MDLSIPLWTEKTGKLGGRDHLGLQSVGQAMLEDLTSGISNITKRLRYYSFYCWVIDSFFTSNQEKTKKNYKRYLNDLSLLYTLSSSSVHRDDSNTGIDGIDFARHWLDKILSREKTIDENTYQSKEYLNNNWIYKAKLNDMLLTSEDVDSSGIPSLVDPWGKKLAEAFRNTVKDIPLAKFTYNSLEASLLADLEKRWCFHRLKESGTERQLLEDILFARHYPKVKKQTNRRYSLVLMLVFIEGFHRFTKPEYERWIYDDAVSLPPQLTKLKRLWKLLFSRNYLVFSFESLFMAFLYSIKEKPLPLEEFMSAIDTINDNSQGSLQRSFHEQLDRPVSEFITKIYHGEVPNSASSAYEPSLIIDLDGQKRNVAAENILKFIVQPVFCLFSLYLRYLRYDASDEEQTFLQMGDAYRVSLKSLFDYIEVSIQQRVTLRQFIFTLYNTNILPRHLTFAHDKYWSRSLDTFHFQMEDDRYIFVKRDSMFEPMYNFMKFDEILNFFEDLGIAERNDNNAVLLTERGRSLIKEFYE